MNVEQFIERFCAVLYTEDGWSQPLTPARLRDLLQQTLAEYHEEIYR